MLVIRRGLLHSRPCWQGQTRRKVGTQSLRSTDTHGLWQRGRQW